MPEKSSEGLLVSGQVVDLLTGRGLEDLVVEVWDRERRIDGALGGTVTDAEGGFQIPLEGPGVDEWLAQRQPEAYFKILRGDRLLLSTEEMVVWGPQDVDEPVVIELDIEAAEALEPWLQIGSFEELVEHEQEILERIAELPNGGNLFMAHPLMLLRDIGVVLSEQALEEVIAREPHLTALSPQPYLALKRSRQEQKVRFHLQGLFKGDEA